MVDFFSSYFPCFSIPHLRSFCFYSLISLPVPISRPYIIFSLSSLNFLPPPYFSSLFCLIFLFFLLPSFSKLFFSLFYPFSLLLFYILHFSSRRSFPHILFFFLQLRVRDLESDKASILIKLEGTVG